MKVTVGIARSDNNQRVVEIILPAERPSIEIPLDDGVVILSPIVKSDRQFLEEGLDMLSIESRYARFGQGISNLSDRELDYLTDLDQTKHVAWGAALNGEIAGVGRYIAANNDCPEVAVTVLDEFQARGVGPVLFAALAAVARHDGHHELCFEMSEDNEAVRKLLETYELSPIASGGTMDRRIRLSDLPTSPYEDGLVAVMREVRAKS